VPDRNVAFFAEHIEYLKAVRLGNIFKVHSAERMLNHFHEVDYLVRIVLPVLTSAVYAERHGVNAA
jgi:hypothetical protein